MAAELLDFTGSPHGGVHKLLPEWQSQPQIIPVGAVKHTIVGSAAGAFYYFRDLTGTESTIILPKTGVIWQCMSLVRVSDAQVAGNSWIGSDGRRYGFLSYETEDNGDPEHDPWTGPQVDSIMWLDDKLARIFGWPRRQTLAPYGDKAGGSGYHSMWGINTATTHPNPWTTANGKTCPATPRIAQYKTTLLPAYVSGTTPEEDDMFEQPDRDKLSEIRNDVNALLTQFDPLKANSLIDKLNRTGGRLADVQAALLAGIEGDADRDARILGRLDTLTLDLSDADVAQLADALDLDEQKVADAIRRDLSEALADPAA